MNTTFKRTIYLGIAGLSVILFIIGSFYDLPIAQAVYRPNHPAALVFSVIGLYLFFPEPDQKQSQTDPDPDRLRLYRFVHSRPW